mmetsp:Transcript_110376/g.285345  ORF Transcript_110376/g.285345 Transcript_110376/m.285345 type:complete len:287 (+) Transcript_110376:383-1243(+)
MGAHRHTYRWAHHHAHGLPWHRWLEAWYSRRLHLNGLHRHANSSQLDVRRWRQAPNRHHVRWRDWRTRLPMRNLRRYGGDRGATLCHARRHRANHCHPWCRRWHIGGRVLHDGDGWGDVRGALCTKHGGHHHGRRTLWERGVRRPVLHDGYRRRRVRRPVLHHGTWDRRAKRCSSGEDDRHWLPQWWQHLRAGQLRPVHLPGRHLRGHAADRGSPSADRRVGGDDGRLASDVSGHTLGDRLLAPAKSRMHLRLSRGCRLRGYFARSTGWLRWLRHALPLLRRGVLR